MDEKALDEFDKAWREFAADCEGIPIKRVTILAKGLVLALDERKALMKVMDAAKKRLESEPNTRAERASDVELQKAYNAARDVIDGPQWSLADMPPPT